MGESIDTRDGVIVVGGGYAGLHAALASAHQRKGDLANAAAEYERALGADPGNSEYLVSLALVYIAQDSLVDAGGLLDEALSRKPDLALAHFLRGLIHEKQGNPERAIVAYRMALEQSGSDVALQKNVQAQLQRLEN